MGRVHGQGEYNREYGMKGENVLSATRVRKKALRDRCHRPKGERISQLAPVFF